MNKIYQSMLLLASTTLAVSVAHASTTITLNQQERIMAGYLDLTSSGSAPLVNLEDVVKSGYNSAMFGFASVHGTDISFSNADYEGIEERADTKIAEAVESGINTYVVVGGGEGSSYHPEGDYELLAQNMVDFIKNNGFTGIDFDIEIPSGTSDYNSPEYLKKLVSSIKKIDSTIKIIIAPQISSGKKLVSTGDSEFYAPLLSNDGEKNLVDYIFVQNYNGPFLREPGFIKDAFDIATSASLAGEGQSTTSASVVIGYPTSASGGGNCTVYFPTLGETECSFNMEGALTTYEAMKAVYEYLPAINLKNNFAGFMGWSLNTDFVPDMYPSDVDHAKASYGIYMSPCALSGKCENIPDEIIVAPTKTIHVTNNSEVPGINIVTFQNGSEDPVIIDKWIKAKSAGPDMKVPVGDNVAVSVETGAGTTLKCPSTIDTLHTAYNNLSFFINDDGNIIECTFDHVDW